MEDGWALESVEQKEVGFRGEGVVEMVACFILSNGKKNTTGRP